MPATPFMSTDISTSTREPHSRVGAASSIRPYPCLPPRSSDPVRPDLGVARHDRCRHRGQIGAHLARRHHLDVIPEAQQRPRRRHRREPQPHDRPPRVPGTIPPPPPPPRPPPPPPPPPGGAPRGARAKRPHPPPPYPDHHRHPGRPLLH